MSKRIAYDYLFNYFPKSYDSGRGESKDTYNGKLVAGATITLCIKVYKDSKEGASSPSSEVLFEEEKEISESGKYLSDVFDVSFDREKLFVVKKNIMVDNIFRLMYGWDRIEAEVVEYSIDTFMGTLKDLPGMEDFASELDDMPVSEPNSVSEEQFRSFLSSHKDGFDISDNKYAQVPSYSFLEVA